MICPTTFVHFCTPSKTYGNLGEKNRVPELNLFHCDPLRLFLMLFRVVWAMSVERFDLWTWEKIRRILKCIFRVCAERLRRSGRILTNSTSFGVLAEIINSAKFQVEQWRGLNFVGPKLSCSDRKAQWSLTWHRAIVHACVWAPFWWNSAYWAINKSIEKMWPIIKFVLPSL